MTILSEVKKVTDELELVIGRSIRAALETDANPGNTVNSTGNPLQIAVAGSFDLLKVAKRVRTDIEAFLVAHGSKLDAIAREADEAVKKVEIEAEKKLAEAKTVVERLGKDIEHVFTDPSATPPAAPAPAAPADAPTP